MLAFRGACLSPVTQAGPAAQLSCLSVFFLDPQAGPVSPLHPTRHPAISHLTGKEAYFALYARQALLYARPRGCFPCWSSCDRLSLAPRPTQTVFLCFLGRSRILSRAQVLGSPGVTPGVSAGPQGQGEVLVPAHGGGKMGKS